MVKTGVVYDPHSRKSGAACNYEMTIYYVLTYQVNWWFIISREAWPIR